jgi:predicted DNA-binding transcriptional regulator AlpA
VNEGKQALLREAPVHRKGMSLAELLALPVAVDLPTAARALGLGRSTAYELVKHGEFPCRVLQVRSSYRVPTAELLRVLGVAADARAHVPPAA